MGIFGPPNIEKMKAKKNVKGLIKALGYRKNSDVCEAAAEALGTIGDALAVVPLITTLKDGEWCVRQAAAEALGVTGDARAVEPLIAALKDANNAVREAAAEALGVTGDARAIEPLIAVLKDRHPPVREAAAGALGRIGDARAVDPLIATLGDENGYARKAAVAALEVLGWKPDHGIAGAWYWVAKHEWKKASTLGSVAVERLIVALKEEGHKYGDVRWAAAEALGAIGAPAVEPLIAVLKWHRPRHPRYAASETDVRWAAAEALGQIGDVRAVEPLIAALKDEDAGVRQSLARALERTTGQDFEQDQTKWQHWWNENKKQILKDR